MAPGDNAVLKQLSDKYSLKLNDPNRVTPLFLKLITTIKNNNGFEFELTSIAHYLITPDGLGAKVTFTPPDMISPTSNRPGLSISKCNDIEPGNSIKLKFDLVEQNGKTVGTHDLVMEIER